MNLDQELAEAGFNSTSRMLLRNACEKYSSVVETLKAVDVFNDLSELQNEHFRLEFEVLRLRREKEELDTAVSQNRNMINAVNHAYFQGFDTLSLPMISELAKNLGGPYKVAMAIQKYGSIKEIEIELKTKEAELENVKKEISEEKSYHTAIQYTLEETKEAYEKSREVKQVVELLVNPRGMKMDKSEVVWLLTRVLDSSILRIEKTFEISSIPNPEWDAIYESLKALTHRLRQFSEGPKH
jgi:hypothetical protein